MQYPQTAAKAHRPYAISSDVAPTFDDSIDTVRQENGAALESLSQQQSHSLYIQSPTELAGNSWDSWWETEAAIDQGAHCNGRSRTCLATPQEGTVSAMARRDSESSVSSTTLSNTPPADRVYSWSTSTTPESVSPTSPPDNGQLIQIKRPERTSSKIVFNSNRTTSPTRTPQGQTACRALRSSSAMSRSISTRLHSTPIKLPVPEEEEHSVQHDVHPNQGEDRNPECTPTTSSSSSTSHNGAIESPLHQRRQQRQHKLATYSPFPQPQKTKLSPLPPLPIEQCPNQRPSKDTAQSLAPTRRPLNKETTRSLPQLRNLTTPLPEALPPLPLVPQFSPMFPASLVSKSSQSPTTLTVPTTGTINAPPPHPTMPPPPPPLWTAAAVPAKSLDKESITTTLADLRSSKHASQQQLQKQHQTVPSDRWEDELWRHKQLLRQFPQQPDHQSDRLKVSRTHKSLGNLRARSRAHSTPSACDTIVTSSSGIEYAASAGHGVSRASKHSKSRSLWDNTGRLDEPLPLTPQPDAPHVSIFEEDSDDERDTVRQFVRNLFTRRARSSEIAPIGSGAHENLVTASSYGPKDSGTSKAADTSSHNSRKKNYSASSSFSVVAPVGANMSSPTGTTIAVSGTDTSSCNDTDGQTDLPRTSCDHVRQRGPLLTRMFVRRSH